MTTTLDTQLPTDCEVHRGAVLHFLEDPGNDPEPRPHSLKYFEDGLLILH